MMVSWVTLGAMVVSLLATMSCRIYQVIKPGEDMSLFFCSEFFCFMIGLAAFLLIVLVTKFFSKSSCNSCCGGEVGFKVNKNPFLALVAMAFGIVVCIDGIMMLISYVNGYRFGSPLSEGIFATIGGPVFALTGVSHLLGKNLFKDNELLTILPVAWGAARTINIFLSYNITSNVAWNLSDVLAIIFSSLFLLNHAKCIANREDPKKLNNLRLYGCSAVMFLVMYTTKGILAGTAFSDLDTNNVAFSFISNAYFVDIVMALYTLTVVINTELCCNNKECSTAETYA